MKFGSLFAGSELSQQVIIRKVWTGENERQPLDWGTVGRYAIWYFFQYFNYVHTLLQRNPTKQSSRFRGFFVFPHILKRWFMFLDRRFVGSSWRTIVSKTAVDQLIIPLPILSSFYVFLSALEGKTDIFEECNV